MLFITKVVNVSLVYLVFVAMIAKGKYTTYYMEDYCYSNSTINLQTKENSSIILKGFNQSSPQDDPSCLVNIYSDFMSGIIVSINRISFADGSCSSGDIVQFKTPEKVVWYCESYPIPVAGQSSFLFYEPNLTIEYFYFSEKSSGWSIKAFDVILTAYENSPCVDKGMYECFNGACIWGGLLCDGINNCGDNSDEAFNPNLSCNVTVNWNYLFLIPVICLIPFTVVGCKIAMFLCCGRSCILIGRPPSIGDDITPLVSSPIALQQQYDMQQIQDSSESSKTGIHMQSTQITPLVSPQTAPSIEQSVMQQRKPISQPMQSTMAAFPSTSPIEVLYAKDEVKRKPDTPKNYEIGQQPSLQSEKDISQSFYPKVPSTIVPPPVSTSIKIPVDSTPRTAISSTPITSPVSTPITPPLNIPIKSSQDLRNLQQKQDISSKEQSATVSPPVSTSIKLPVSTPSTAMVRTPTTFSDSTPITPPLSTPITPSQEQHKMQKKEDISQSAKVQSTTVPPPVSAPGTVIVSTPSAVIVNTPIASPVSTPIATPLITPITPSQDQHNVQQKQDVSQKFQPKERNNELTPSDEKHEKPKAHVSQSPDPALQGTKNTPSSPDKPLKEQEKQDDSQSSDHSSDHTSESPLIPSRKQPDTP